MKFKKFLSIALSSLMVFQASFVCKANDTISACKEDYEIAKTIYFGFDKDYEKYSTFRFVIETCSGKQIATQYSAFLLSNAKGSNVIKEIFSTNKVKIDPEKTPPNLVFVLSTNDIEEFYSSTGSAACNNVSKVISQFQGMIENPVLGLLWYEYGDISGSTVRTLDEIGISKVNNLVATSDTSTPFSKRFKDLYKSKVDVKAWFKPNSTLFNGAVSKLQLASCNNPYIKPLTISGMLILAAGASVCACKKLVNRQSSKNTAKMITPKENLVKSQN